MVKFIQEIGDLLDNIGYAWQERKTTYIDNKVLNEHYRKDRDLYKEKIDGALAHLKNNSLTQTLHEKFIADEYLDKANLWEKESRLAKNINDNRDDVRGTLLGMFTAYATSLGVAGAAAITASTDYKNGSNIFSDIPFFGFLIIFGLTISAGVFNQRRLNRLVKEHKDYKREFEETKDLIEKKSIC